MSIYKRTYNPEIDKITQLEIPLYGSSRLGLHEVNKEIARYIYPNNTIVLAPMSENKRILGLKKFEMTNHLGNVLSVISDRKLSINTGGVNHYVADVVSFSDYYPFGMQMPNRNAGQNDYRFSFNGMEKDDEVKGGSGNHMDFGARAYDSRLGRWFTVDPYGSNYPHASPYNFALNTPIQAKDPDGNLVIFVSGLRKAATERYIFRKGKPWDTKLYTDDYNYYTYPKASGLNNYCGYWNLHENSDQLFMQQFNDYNDIYVDGMYSARSSAQERYDRGVADGKAILEKIESGEIILKDGETIKLVGHSHGGWHSTGLADVLEEAGLPVEVLISVQPHQPDATVNRIVKDPSYFSVQFSRKSDRVSSAQHKQKPRPLADWMMGDSEYGKMNGYDALYELENFSDSDIKKNPITIPYGGHRINNAIFQVIGIMKDGYPSSTRDDNWDHSDGKDGASIPDDAG